MSRIYKIAHFPPMVISPKWDSNGDVCCWSSIMFHKHLMFPYFSCTSPGFLGIFWCPAPRPTMPQAALEPVAAPLELEGQLAAAGAWRCPGAARCCRRVGIRKGEFSHGDLMGQKGWFFRMEKSSFSGMLGATMVSFPSEKMVFWWCDQWYEW